MTDGLCDCTCGDRCPLGKTGVAARCTHEELEQWLLGETVKCKHTEIRTDTFGTCVSCGAKTNRGVPFYFLDGPMKGRVIYTDFKPSSHGGTDYQKATFGSTVRYFEHEYRVHCDVAYSAKMPDRLPDDAMGNVVITKFVDDSPELDLSGRIEILKLVGFGGEIPRVEIENGGS